MTNLQKSISLCLILLLMGLLACNNEEKESKDSSFSEGTFGYDLNFLQKQDSNLVVLKNKDGNAQIIVSPKYQAKVFTSTAEGLEGHSFGWVHYPAFSGSIDEHMNAYGGENRFWLGPEGGIYSLFFKPGDSMTFENWHTPPAFDSESWDLTSQEKGTSVRMHKDMSLLNYQGSQLFMGVNRTVKLLDKKSILQKLGLSIADSVALVGYQTDQTLKNTGDFEWDKETGMPSIWILDMFTPSKSVVIAIPFKPLKDTSKRIATTDYFGEIPSDRLIFKDSIMYFKADGKSRGKLGLPPYRSKGIEGSYDAENHALTILVTDDIPNEPYLYQKWDTLGDPFDGDALNAYNDGPLEDGSQMGPFYEMESVSPAAFLKPGESLSHRQNVYHFMGSEEALNPISKKILGVSIKDMMGAFE